MTNRNRSAGCATLCAALLGLPGAHAADDATVLARNKQLVTRYFEEVWNQGKVDVLDELIAPDYINHSPGIPNPRPGPADLKPIVREMRKAIPDLRYEILDMAVTPDKVAVHLRVTGTHRAPLFGMQPKGHKIDVRQMQFEWIRDGKIVQHWRITDDLSLLKQIGQL